MRVMICSLLISVNLRYACKHAKTIRTGAKKCDGPPVDVATHDQFASMIDIRMDESVDNLV